MRKFPYHLSYRLMLAFLGMFFAMMFWGCLYLGPMFALAVTIGSVVVTCLYENTLGRELRWCSYAIFIMGWPAYFAVSFIWLDASRLSEWRSYIRSSEFLEIGFLKLK